MHSPVSANRAATTGGMLTVDPSDGLLAGTSQDFVGPLTVQLLVGHDFLDAVSGRHNQLGHQVFGPLTSKGTPWRRSSPSS